MFYVYNDITNTVTFDANCNNNFVESLLLAIPGHFSSKILVYTYTNVQSKITLLALSILNDTNLSLVIIRI